MLVLLFTILTGSLLAQTAELPAYLDPRLSRQLFEEEFPTLLQSRTLKLKNPVNVFVHDKWLYAAGKRMYFTLFMQAFLFTSMPPPMRRFYEQPGVFPIGLNMLMTTGSIRSFGRSTPGIAYYLECSCQY